MSVAGWKKKKQTARMLFGAGVIGVPLMLCVAFLGISCLRLKQELQVCQRKIAQKTYSTAYCLKTGKKAGESIGKADLEQIMLSTDADKQLPVYSLKDLVGKVAKTDMAKGSIVSELLLTEKENAGEDVRRCTYSEIAYGTDVKEGSFVDIRISFPNGEDYIVVRHKEILAVSDEERVLTFFLGEAELLRLSSAFVDKEQYKDVEIYAAVYRDTLQEASLITYPVNPQVYALTGWDPNVTENDGVDSIAGESRSETQIREQLEENLAPYRLESALDAETETENGDSKKNANLEQTGNEQSENEMEEFFP